MPCPELAGTAQLWASAEHVADPQVLPNPSPGPALPRGKPLRGGSARGRSRVGWGHRPEATTAGASPARTAAGREAPGLREAAARGGKTSCGGITGQLCSRAGKIQPRTVPSCGKAPGPVTQPWLLRGRLRGPGASARFSRGETSASFPGAQHPPSPLFEPPRPWCQALGAAAGTQMPPPARGCLAPLVPPGEAPRGRSRLVPAQITAWAGINGLGRSGAVTTH